MWILQELEAQGRLIRPPLPPYLEPDSNLQSWTPRLWKRFQLWPESNLLRWSSCASRSAGHRCSESISRGLALFLSTQGKHLCSEWGYSVKPWRMPCIWQDAILVHPATRALEDAMTTDSLRTVIEFELSERWRNRESQRLNYSWKWDFWARFPWALIIVMY